jgi:hypothetical protein
MKHLKKSFVLLMLLTVISGSRTSAQVLSLEEMLSRITREREKEVRQDNEYNSTCREQGDFYINPLRLNGKPLDYNDFSLASTGELTVIKGDKNGDTTRIPFFVYLRRNGNIVPIPGKETFHLNQTKADISEILKYAKPEDQLVIEAVNKEDGAVKTILKLLKCGC